MPTLAAIRLEMVDCGRILYERGLVGANEGNLSVRFDQQILSTPRGASLRDLDPAGLVLFEPNDIDSRASSEIKVHLALYRELPHIGAVVHAHPITATAFGVAGREIPTCRVAEGRAVLGEVPIVPFQEPGSHELAEGIARLAEGHVAWILAEHGAVTVGASLREATDRMEVLERVAQIAFKASQLEAI